MAEFTLKVRRFQPEEAEGPYWETFDVDLDPTLSVLDGLLQAKDRVVILYQRDHQVRRGQPVLHVGEKAFDRRPHAGRVAHIFRT